MGNVNGAEAIAGFFTWLANREQVTCIGASVNNVPVCELMEKFCELNRLGEIRPHWNDLLKFPEE